jgi:large subunit ribosomal protein L24e
MVKCTFCGDELRQGTGKMYVFSNGKIAYFCSNKCEKNQLKLGRTARNLKWTNMYEKGAQA